ncbi:MAG TPA: carbamoyl-phosphate synthase large subunit [Phycisphaerae bacterium]|nr:carbamoyl-phosphate synthase large subunit [Phycisphaerae bacterium]
MPRRTDIHTILLIGSGPIVIGQGCEFDYSGTQACKALRAEGFRVVLLNSNPATIMTDPQVADRTYIEPITPEFVEKILELERSRGTPVDALLPTMGGQTALNCAMEVSERGILEKYGVKLIGASREAIAKAEDRSQFREAMIKIGLDVPNSGTAHSMDEAREVRARVSLPCCIRPAYTLGGEGGGFCRTMEEFETIAERGLKRSRIGEILIEESLYGWKEYELEVIRDCNDNVIIVCSIENVDPMGVHTGDSITVAPAQTLSDREYQQMRDSAKAIMREIGVDTGGSNVQFAVDPKTGRQVVIEMNPRVSRSSALASKATGYPIAKVAAKLAVGYTLDEIPNDITRTTPASFEPVIDYCVVKMPRWTFEKFPDADETLTTHMKSVGEAMAIGRTFKEAFQKCIRSMEIQRAGYGLDKNDRWLAAMQRQRLDAVVTSQEARVIPSGARGVILSEAKNLVSGASFAKVKEFASPARSFVAAAPQDDRIPQDDAVVSASPNDTPILSLASRQAEAPPDTEESSATHWPIAEGVLRAKLERPSQGRPYYIRYAFKQGWSVERVNALTGIDPWFLDQMKELAEFEDELLESDETITSKSDSGRATRDSMLSRAKRMGYSDAQLAHASPRRVGDLTAFLPESHVDRARTVHRAVAHDHSCFKLVDTCAAEFEAATPYYYSTSEVPFAQVVAGRVVSAVEDELRIGSEPHVVVIGGGPNRIGQGIEFDYCCVHASDAARAMGFKSVMINSNPETVSTDYDTSDLLFFEPLTLEDVLRVIRAVQARTTLQGVIIQFGGQTPLNLGEGLKAAGVPILGTPPESIDLAEDRKAFSRILNELGLRQPPSAIAETVEEAKRIANELGYPVLIRPSYVLGGRAMELCNNDADLMRYAAAAFAASDRLTAADESQRVLVDKFILDAMEIDVDSVSDFRHPGDERGECVVCGVMEHIEEAGIHSGDSTCALPPHSLSPELLEEVRRQTRMLARRLGVCGLMNVQFAIAGETIYVLEVNPRASRTVPFVSKATGVPWAKVATQVMLGRELRDVLWEMGVGRSPRPLMQAIKAPVFPFSKFPGVDVVLGPEMRSTGEVMGIDATFGLAFAKAAIATGLSLPMFGNALVSVNDPDKPRVVPIARALKELGFKLFSTIGTHKILKAEGIESIVVSKQAGAPATFLLDLINHGVLDLLINTPIHYGPAWEEGRWRAAATAKRIPLITTLAGARAAVEAIKALRAHAALLSPGAAGHFSGTGALGVRALQDYAVGIA